MSSSAFYFLRNMVPHLVDGDASTSPILPNDGYGLSIAVNDLLDGNRLSDSRYNSIADAIRFAYSLGARHLLERDAAFQGKSVEKHAADLQIFEDDGTPDPAA